MNRTENVHDELMKAVRVYFEANQKWEKVVNKQTGIRLRHALSTIKRLSGEQRFVVRGIMDDYEIVLAEKLAIRKLQDQQDKKDTGDN
jgi:hypothetical protein